MREQEQGPARTAASPGRAPRNRDPAVQLTDLGVLAARLAAVREKHDADHRAYTVRKAVGFRQVLLAISQRGRLREREIDGEVAIQVLSGEVAVAVQGVEHLLRAGALLNIAPRLRHQLFGRRSNSSVLLTITRAKRHPAPASGPPRPVTLTLPGD